MVRPAFWLIRFGGAALITAFLPMPYLVYRGDGFVKLRKMRMTSKDPEEELALRAQNHEFRREIRHLRNDPAAITAVARDELGLVKPGPRLTGLRVMLPSG